MKKALILAAGLGTRLRVVVNDRPKALVEVAGVTMLERVVNHLKQYGVDDITINVHHLAQQIVDFVAARNNFGVTIHFSDERDLLLDTGGAIVAARQWLDGNEPFIVHNADILTDLDFDDMEREHIESGALATILVKHRPTQRYFLFDRQRRLQGWVNKTTGETRPAGLVYTDTEYDEMAFGGIYILSPEIFPALEAYAKKSPVFSIVPFYVDHCRTLPIHAYCPPRDYLWLDVGKPNTFALANEIYAAR